MLTPLPATWTATRVELHRVAVHVLARRRSELVGKIGLRATPGGIATAAAGPEHEVVRTSGAWLLCERTGVTASTRSLHLAGATLAEAAAGRTNLGVSPGDAGHPDPYLYVGPWGPERPGDDAYWNAPFGAVLGRADLQAAGDPHATAVAFLRRGIDLPTRVDGAQSR